MRERLGVHFSIPMHTHSTQVPVDCWLLLVREYVQQFMIAPPNNKHTMYSRPNQCTYSGTYIRDPVMLGLVASFCATIFHTVCNIMRRLLSLIFDCHHSKIKGGWKMEVEQVCILRRCVSSPFETLPVDLSTAGSRLAVLE